jgi:hypothetical protein
MEDSIPYNLQRIEDVMFVDEKSVVALEYKFYQQIGEYVRIQKEKAH